MQLEVWMDFGCPWCLLARTRLDLSLAAFEHAAEVSVITRSWQNDPTAPRDYRMTMSELVVARYGMSPEEAKAANAHVAALAAAEGLSYRIETARPGNSFDAQRLFHWARTRGRGEPFARRVLEAFICEELPIGDHRALAGVAESVGLPCDDADRVLAGDAFADDVARDRELGSAIGLHAVPYFVFDRRTAVAGAQPVATFDALLQEAWARGGAAAGAPHHG
jgi:predicted DsbA family dithiol-disulfide isomerase